MIKVNADWVENRTESPNNVRLGFELLLSAMSDLINLRQRIRDEQVASVKIVMIEELISVMNKFKYYVDGLEG